MRTLLFIGALLFFAAESGWAQATTIGYVTFTVADREGIPIRPERLTSGEFQLLAYNMEQDVSHKNDSGPLLRYSCATGVYTLEGRIIDAPVGLAFINGVDTMQLVIIGMRPPEMPIELRFANGPFLSVPEIRPAHPDFDRERLSWLPEGWWRLRKEIPTFRARTDGMGC